MKKKSLLFFVLCFVLTGLYAQDFVSVGSGSYTTQFPGTDIAGRNSYPSGTPYLSGEAATKPVPTNDWWSNLIKEAHGGQAFNYPLSYRSLNEGLVINYTMPGGAGPSEYREPMSDVKAITVGVQGLDATQSTASDHSDWAVTINWNDGANDFSALMGHGMPFTYFTKGNSDVARIKIGFNAAGSYISGNKIIIENNYGGANFIVYGPAGTVWNGSGGDFTSTLNGENYWSMVMVPASMSMSTAISYFENYAFVFPTETQVTWNYNESTSVVKTDFVITPDVKEGAGNVVFWGILPHHWANMASGTAQPSSISYNTVRGELKMMTSNTFSTELRFSGILPTLPELGKYSGSFNPAELFAMVDQIKSDGLPTWTDSYNEGQSMNRLVQTARIADQLGYTDARDQLLATVKERLEDWLSAESGEKAFLFYYNNDWKALIGYPAGHRQDNNLNDHHFHWGYFIHAAAAIEQYYPGWAQQWGDMIYMLIRDAANPSRSDSMFPFLRNYSPYAGHCWANGFATEPFGNDQESTSESMQFNSALIHWGTVTGNDAIRDLGIYLYTTEHSSVNEYWFDQNNRTFQSAYQYEMVARIWGAGYDNGTWWTSDVAASYGIQLYPIHGGSLYLGHNTDYVQEVWNGMKANTDVLNNIPNDNLWYDTYWKFLSFLDAEQALSLYNNYQDRNMKMGISAAQTYQWLHTMVALGQVAEDITADYPIAAVFVKNGAKTYAAHNYGNSQITVHFSDGYNLVVPARSRATSKDVVATAEIQAGSVELPNGGSTVLTASVTGNVTKVEFYKENVLLGTDYSAPYSINTGSLQAGFPGFYAKVYVGSGFNLSNVIQIQVGEQLPYLGTPYVIPGTIETGNYDMFEGGSGQGIAYSDNTTWNEGGYRPDEAVDASIETNEGATVGWIEAGEWLEYTVNVQNPGTYKATIRYANGSDADGGPFCFKQNNTKVSSDITLSPTGDWGAWQDKIVEDIPLTAGENVLQIYVENGGFNLGKINFEYTGSTQITRIEVSPSSTTIDLNDTQQFIATAYNQNNEVVPASFTWAANGGTITNDGLFTGTVKGNFTITASASEVDGTASVTVKDESSVLTSIVVSPQNTSISLNATQQFVATGYDQNGVQMAISPTWTTTGGSVNSSTGLYTGSEIGSFEVSATQNGITGTASIDIEGTQVCTGGANNGDYTFTVSADASNPSITFIPGNSGVGSNLVIIYYSIGENGPYPGYITSPNTPFTVNAQQGETVYFYYTYNVPEGGERNTANEKHSVVVGNCGNVQTLTRIELSPSNSTIELNETQQFVATGFDQNDNIMSISPTWYTTGGNISSTGLYTGSNSGVFTITASENGISASASITVNDYTPVLSSIVVTPASASVNLDETQQFIATGYDQYNNQMIISPNWSTNGAVVNGNGLFTGTEAGTFNVTATEGSISGSASIEVIGGGGECTGAPSNGDYSYSVSGDANNPSITFIPGYPGVGDNIVILYYGRSENGPYPGYIIDTNTPFTINASQGETIYFYFTYSVPEGGERNTANEKHSVVIGGCSNAKSSSFQTTKAFSSDIDITVFPNPVSACLTIQGLQEAKEIFVFDMSGKQLMQKSVEKESVKIDLNVSGLKRGTYLIKVFQRSSVVTKKFTKKD